MRLGSIYHWRFCLLFFLAVAAAAQVSLSHPPAASDSPVPYASLSQLNLLIPQLEQTSQATQIDLAKLRIEKWKTDSNTKRGAQSDVESIQRNLQAAIPELISGVRASPDSLAATFKLYRNLNALYDVFSSVVESAGAFGSKDEYQSLQNDLDALERSRRAFADRMENLSSVKEAEISDLRMQLRNAQATANAAPPKKIVVDDTEPAAAKAAPKKATAKIKKPGTSTTSQKPATPAKQSAPATPQAQQPQTSQPQPQQPQSQPQ